MKRLVCEMCGGTDLIKRDGVFVCESCGTKYSVEEARKMMVEGVVSVQGTVTIDRTEELKKLYQAARNARETSDDESAIRHYESISAKDPDSWEALFYLVVLKTNSIKNSQIASSAINVSNCLPKVFTLIKENIGDEQARKEAVWEVVQQCQETATWLTSASHNFYKSMTKGNGVMALTGIFSAISSATSTLTELSEDTERCVAIANIMCYCGNYIEEIFGMEDEDYCGYAVWSWKQMMDFHTDYQKVHSTQTLFDNESVSRFTEKIRKYSKKALADTDMCVLTIYFDSNAGSVGQLLYTLDDGEKNTLNRKEQRQHFMKKGKHKISLLNPFMKKEQSFTLDADKTLNLYGKSFGIDIN